jgi:hypothetical protein
LNTDYKILAKAVAITLQKHLGELICSDQSGGIKGRSTFGNLRSTIDVINYVTEHRKPGYLAFIDYEKAFDTVNWSFLYKTLQELNFGEYFVNSIKTLYNDIGSHVANCGFLSEMFKPSRGIRQGCPLSANIFVIIVEILANAIRQNANIQGIKIGDGEFKISQYADDTCMYAGDLNSLKLIFDILELFTKCSGLKVNREKSEALGIGASSNLRHPELGIKWPNDSIKCLGIFINSKTDTIIDDNFKPCLEKIENLLELWCLRKLTLKGKILIANTLAISQLLYAGTILHTPKWVIDKYNNMIKNFIWGNKPAKVKYKCLINTLEQGGLRLQDLETKLKAVKIKWFKNMIDEEVLTPWKAYINTYFQEDVRFILSYNSSSNEYPDFKDKFYTELFKLWAELHCHEPNTAEEITRQQICHNTFIRIEGKPLLWKKWKRTTSDLSKI